MMSLPAAGLSVLFAHPAYRLADEFGRRGAPHSSREVRDVDALADAIGGADVLVVSGLWRNAFLERAPRLRLVQSISVGINQYDLATFRAHGVQLANARGINERAVADHAFALMLALTRRLGEARDNQARGHWRPMIGNASVREQELDGMTLLVVGLGRIGTRVARIARAFGMRVIGVRRSAAEVTDVERLVPPSDLLAALPLADIVVLTCPLTPETERLIDARALATMKPTAFLINVARGKVVDEPALIEALTAGRIAGAGLDCTVEEPLPSTSPLWAMPNVVLTPHSAGETRAYEARLIDLLIDNMGRATRGEPLANAIV